VVGRRCCAAGQTDPEVSRIGGNRDNAIHKQRRFYIDRDGSLTLQGSRVADSNTKIIRSRRMRTHPFRGFVLILTGTVAAIGLGYLLLNLLKSDTPPNQSAGSGGVDDAPVQFK